MQNNSSDTPSTQTQRSHRYGLAFTLLSSAVIVIFFLISIALISYYGLAVDDSRFENDQLMSRPWAALQQADGNRVPLPIEGFTDIPDKFSTYERYNLFFETQSRLYAQAKSGHLVLVDDREQVHQITLQPVNLSSLGNTFWLLNLIGAIALVTGLGVWLLRRRDRSTIIFALSGLGFYLIAYSTAIYSNRQILLPANILHFYSELGHLGGLLFRYSLLALFFNYPCRLFPKLPVTAALYIIMMGLWTNQTLQWAQWPIHAFHIHSNGPTFLLLLLFAALQWRHSQGTPLAHTAAKWMIFSIVVTTGIATSAYFLPLAMGSEPLTSPTTTLAIVLIMYVGLSLGVRHTNCLKSTVTGTARMPGS